MSKIVERTLDFLELFAREKRPLSLSDISRLLTIPVSSCHDVLQALQDRGFIYEIAPRGGYYPTLRLYELGKLITENDPVVLRADLVLRELRNTLDETVLLAKATGMSATYLLTFEPSHPLRFQLRPATPSPACTPRRAAWHCLAAWRRASLIRCSSASAWCP